MRDNCNFPAPPLALFIDPSVAKVHYTSGLWRQCVLSIFFSSKFACMARWRCTSGHDAASSAAGKKKNVVGLHFLLRVEREGEREKEITSFNPSHGLFFFFFLSFCKASSKCRNVDVLDRDAVQRVSSLSATAFLPSVPSSEGNRCTHTS